MMKQHSKKNLSIAHPSSDFALIWLIVCLFLACEGGDEPLVLGGQVPENAGEVMAGEVMAGEVMAGIVNGGIEVEIICEEVIDKLRFASEIGPDMIQSCANSACHYQGSTRFELPVDNTYITNPLEEQVLDDSLDAVMGVDRFIVAGKPQESLMLIKASNGHGLMFGTYPRGEAKYEALSSWIKSMEQCTEVEIPQAGQEIGGETAGEEIAGELAGELAGQEITGGGNAEILCELLPNGDPQQRADGQYYDVFEAEVNTILTTSCGRGGCHAGPENGFWLQPLSDPCSVPGNFLMTQAYIDFTNPNTSPILEAPYDPSHSGEGIFTGRTDPNFITVQSWILLGFED